MNFEDFEIRDARIKVDALSPLAPRNHLAGDFAPSGAGDALISVRNKQVRGKKREVPYRFMQLSVKKAAHCNFYISLYNLVWITLYFGFYEVWRKVLFVVFYGVDLDIVSRRRSWSPGLLCSREATQRIKNSFQNLYQQSYTGIGSSHFFVDIACEIFVFVVTVWLPMKTSKLDFRAGEEIMLPAEVKQVVLHDRIFWLNVIGFGGSLMWIGSEADTAKIFRWFGLLRGLRFLYAKRDIRVYKLLDTRPPDPFWTGLNE